MSILIACVGVIMYAVSTQPRRIVARPESYVPLLDLIAKVESKGNYNAYFGNSANSSVNFTDMSIQEVLRWQKDHVKRGNPSNAVGRYQIVDTTLSGLVQRYDIDTDQKFDQVMQDGLAIALLERRGAEKYVNHELTREQFAANLAMEWAALPKVIGERPAESYYAGDGLNRALVGVDEVMKAIEPIGP